MRSGLSLNRENDQHKMIFKVMKLKRTPKERIQAKKGKPKN